MGERTDLRNDHRGWNGIDFDDSGWDQVSLRAAPGSRLVAALDEGIRAVETLPAVSVHTAGPDRHIVDLGANAAGVVRLRTAGTPGQHIVIRHAEALDADGELYTENLRGAEWQDEFILADTGPVSLEPQFTFHGFRYAEVSGLPAPLAANDVEPRVLRSATRLVGAFACSDPLVDTLQRNIVTSLRANLISIPTDCPQRHERLGWTADLQIFAPAALFNADVTNMIDKWLDDLVDTQLPSGAYADIAPAPSGWAGAGNTACSDAGVVVPWVLYERSGDAGVLDRLYDSMRCYTAFLETDQTNALRFGGRYGDWVSSAHAPTSCSLAPPTWRTCSMFSAASPLSSAGQTTRSMPANSPPRCGKRYSAGSSTTTDDSRSTRRRRTRWRSVSTCSRRPAARPRANDWRSWCMPLTRTWLLVFWARHWSCRRCPTTSNTSSPVNCCARTPIHRGLFEVRQGGHVDLGALERLDARAGLLLA